MKKPTTMLLEANFDVDQVGETLVWKFSRADGDGNPVKGRYAGEIYFTVGEEFHVRVRAGGYKKFDGFKIIDCCLITRPQVRSVAPGVAPEFASPSPFVDNEFSKIAGATFAVPPADFVNSKVIDPDPQYFEIAQQWKNHLTVGQSTGRWEFSFVLTVVITNGANQRQRVFTFDPEGEVGAGVSPHECLPLEGDMVALECDLDPEGEVGAGVSPA